ncbi:guanylate kinase [candidate division KSB1 bacterium]|nr:guanylate kinase [candidate division KSB1 bacterium]
MNGLLVILSSPSGGGKTTVIQRLLKTNEFDFKYSISATTRQPRPGEIDGIDYFFLSEHQFREKIDRNDFIEWERVHDYYYGTPRDQIESWLNEDKVVLLDIDVQGGLRIRQEYAENSVTIFIAPPSVDELIRRLRNRKTDSHGEIEKRLRRVPLEMERGKQFDHVIVNNDLEVTIAEVIRVINLHQL